MSRYITIDCGTTNSRVRLVVDNRILGAIKIPVGARSGAERLKAEFTTAIEQLLCDRQLAEKDIERILASGMITSEYGLCPLEHIKTPAGLKELHETLFHTMLPEISSIPFTFIRGVKTDANSFEEMDIMRGEETEMMGLLNPDYGKCVYVLPGSHSKLVLTDNTGRIVAFSTMLTGEMIFALSQDTILKDAVNLDTAQLNVDCLLKGYDYCEKEGVNKALFKTRILKNVFQCNEDETYSFFLGAILCDEIRQIIASDAKTVVLGGRAQIKTAMAKILQARDTKTVIALDETTADYSTALGAVRIYEA